MADKLSDAINDICFVAQQLNDRDDLSLWKKLNDAVCTINIVRKTLEKLL